jgi:hypothetical protein
MADLIIKQDDLQSAIDFLTEYLTEQVPEATFTDGSALRDLMVKAFAPMYAYLRAEADRSAILQSISRIQTELANGSTATLDTTDISQAVDAVLSNWFVTRSGGARTSGMAQLHFTRRTAIVIRRDTKFWRSTTLAFYPDIASETFVIAENQLRPVYDTRGRLVDYVANVPIIAARVGDLYDFEAGRFIRIEAPGGLPFFSYAEHQQLLTGGASTEGTAEFLDRAQTVITVRNFINNRSIDTVINEQAPEAINILTVGMGEPEMVRDLRTEISPVISLHVGGHYDTYLDLPETQVEENGLVGGLFARPDGLVNVFRDPQLTYDLGGGRTFTSFGLEAGHILYVISGIVGAPRGFPITLVTDHAIYVSENSPFDEASDELDTNALEYSIGWYAPTFSEVDLEGTAVYSRIATASTNPTYASVPAGTSRQISEPGAIVLSGNPVQDVISVEITDPAAGALVDPATGTLRFTNRVNTTPILGSVLGTAQYQVECINPSKGQSAEGVVFIRVGPLTAPTMYDGKNLRVSYRTSRTFATLHTLFRSYGDRVVAANHLVKARNPIWVYANIPYRLKPTATDALPVTSAQSVIAEHINIFDPNDDLDMSDLSTVLRDEYPDVVGTVFPFTIEYDLHTPDGQRLEFETTDIVSIYPKSTNGVTLMNGADLLVPAALVAQGITTIATTSDLNNLYAYYGISDRTVTYKSRSELITFALRG